MLHAPLLAYASRQHGCIARRQALGHLNARQLRYLVDKQQLRCVAPNVYVFNGFKKSWLQDAWSAQLSVAGSAVSTFVAARLHGLECRNGPLSLLAPTANQRRKHVTISAASYDRQHVTTVQGLPVTTVARTICDLANELEITELERLVDYALLKKLVTLSRLTACLLSLPKQRQRRLLFDVTAARVRNDEQIRSWLEQRFLHRLRQLDYPEPVANFPVFLDGHKFYSDLAYPSHKVLIEVDGSQHRLLCELEKDVKRRRLWEVAGWQYLAVTKDTTDREFASMVALAFASAEK